MPRQLKTKEKTASPPSTHHPARISSCQKITVLGATFIVAGYAAFSDVMACVYLMLPVPLEYQFDQQLTKSTWLIITATTASIYGLSTLLCEGKGVYDTVNDYFIHRNKNRNPRKDEERPELAADETPLLPSPMPFFQPPPPKPCRKKLFFGFVWLFPRLVAVISSSVSASETTMGLVKEGAALPKTIAISTLSFLSSVFFYGPITIEALEELLLEQDEPVEDHAISHPLAKCFGYPVAVFSAVQDMLECGSSLFQNFAIVSKTGQWAMICVGSLGGISSLCLDGKKGVEILDAFFIHIQTHQAWLARSLLNRTPPSRAACYQLLYELSATTLAAYAASYIAFADKELTIALTQNILATLDLTVPVLPQALGWCVAFRDFIIQTNALLTLEQLLINLGHFAWRKLSQSCLRSRRAPTPPPELIEQDIELTDYQPQQPATAASLPPDPDEGNDSGDEETALLPQNRPLRARDTEAKPDTHRFFKAPDRRPKQDYLKPEPAWRCCIL